MPIRIKINQGFGNFNKKASSQLLQLQQCSSFLNINLRFVSTRGEQSIFSFFNNNLSAVVFHSYFKVVAYIYCLAYALKTTQTYKLRPIASPRLYFSVNILLTVLSPLLQDIQSQQKWRRQRYLQYDYVHEGV